MILHRRGYGWLFALQSPHGTDCLYHAGFSRSDNTLCGKYSIPWRMSSFNTTFHYCPECLKKAKRHFPELDSMPAQVIAPTPAIQHELPLL